MFPRGDSRRAPCARPPRRWAWARIGAVVLATSVSSVAGLEAVPALASGPTPTTAAAPGNSCKPGLQALPGLGAGAIALAFNSASALVVGSAVDPSFVVGGLTRSRAVYWDPAGAVHVIATGLMDDQANDVNADGLIVGGGVDPVTGLLHAWSYHPPHGQVHLLKNKSTHILATARRINGYGLIAGSEMTHSGKNLAVLWPTRWVMPDRLYGRTRLGDSGSYGSGVNDAGDVSGAVLLGDYAESPMPTWWDRANRRHVLGTLPDAGLPYGLLRPINDNLQATGDLSNIPHTVSHMAVWQDGDVVDLGVLSGDNVSNGFGIAQNGWVVGQSVNLSVLGYAVSSRAVFWSGHGPLRQLPGLTTLPNAISVARSVDSAGTAVGSSTDATGVAHAVRWTCAQKSAVHGPVTPRGKGAPGATQTPPAAAVRAVEQDTWAMRPAR